MRSMAMPSLSHQTESLEIEEGIGAGEGDAVVGSDGFGQSALGKGLIVAATRSGPLTQQRPGVHAIAEG